MITQRYLKSIVATVAIVAASVVVTALGSDQTLAEGARDELVLVHPDDVRGHLTLPTAGSNGATVSWTSSMPNVVAPDGIVNRPANGAGDTTVKLTAEVTVGTSTVSREFELTVRELPALAENTGYFFSYFTGNSIDGEKIHFAASAVNPVTGSANNALQWTELNNGQPVLESDLGTKGLRDPFLIRSPEGDRFFLIATDLSIGRDGDWGKAQRQGSRYLEVWESTDLVNWSDQRHVLVSPPTAGNTWAPEAFWDEENQEYIVFWASQLYDPNDPGHTGNSYNRMLYATTRDFVTFSEAQIWQDDGVSRIDSTVIKEADTDGETWYHRFTKDEGAVTGCSDIIQERSTSLTAPLPSWKFVEGCIGRDAGTSAVEGPTVFKANPGDSSGSKYYLFVDEYGGRGYIPLGTNDLFNSNWQLAANADLPANPRHGTVIPVTRTEHDAVTAKWGPPPPPDPLESNPDGLVLRYGFDQDSGTVVKDSSGHGYDATLVNGGTWTNGALTLDGNDDYVKLPDNVMAGLEGITVFLNVNVAQDQATPFWVYGLGNSSEGAGNGYLFAGDSGNGFRGSIATGNWSTEQTVLASRGLPLGEWTKLTYTLDADGSAKLFIDGVQVGEMTGVTIDPGSIGDGRTLANSIGRSLYSADKYLKGQVHEFALYNRALSQSEILALSGPTTIGGVKLDALKIDAIIDYANSSILLPVVPGTNLKALEPMFVAGEGSTVSPSGPQDYSAPVTLTVTAPDDTSRDWKVSAVEMASPVLPGYNADPNIVRFGDTYYIYATTDGYPGWGSSSFKVWSSKDLVNWTEHGAILNLAPQSPGDRDDVSWADRNAWAPAAIEKDGTYYFYYSAQQNIGVAKSDSPLGPFVDPLGKPLVNKDVAPFNGAQQIDPAVFTDDDGRSYLTWGNGKPWIARLNDDMISIDWNTLTELSGQLPEFREGPFLNKRNGVYYLSYSIDDTGSPNYRVGYAMSDKPMGPYKAPSNYLILEKDVSKGLLGTAHHSIIEAPPGSDKWYICYHRFGIPGGDGQHREVTIDRMFFEDDGSIRKVVPTLESVEPLKVSTPDQSGR